MLQRIDAFFSLVSLLSQVLLANAVYKFGGSDPDLPGWSNKYEVTGASGYGCQTRDSEVMPYRTPERSGDWDGTLWTGETVARINQYSSEQGGNLTNHCNGTLHMPTLLWIGPYLQGENGTNNKFAMGMLTWETNDTDKSDIWHVYRSCDGYTEPPKGVYDPYEEAFELLGAVHYDHGKLPENDSTFGLSLIATPPENQTTNSSSPQLFFTGNYNGVKETEEYLYGDSGHSSTYLANLFSRTNLNCSHVSKGGSLDPPTSPDSELTPGSPLNISITNETVVLRMTGTEESDVLLGVESPDLEPTATGIALSRTEIELTFIGRYDAYNSSQSLVISPSNETVLAFLGAGSRLSVSLLPGVLVLLTLAVLM